MNKILEYKGYHAKIEFDAKDVILVGEVLGVNDSLSFNAKSVNEIIDAFHQSIDEYLELCKEIGKNPDKEFKGMFNIRISPDLHKKLYYKAEEEGISMNSFIERALNTYFEPNIFADFKKNFEFFKDLIHYPFKNQNEKVLGSKNLNNCEFNYTQIIN